MQQMIYETTDNVSVNYSKQRGNILRLSTFRLHVKPKRRTEYVSALFRVIYRYVIGCFVNHLLHHC